MRHVFLIGRFQSSFVNIIINIDQLPVLGGGGISLIDDDICNSFNGGHDISRPRASITKGERLSRSPDLLRLNFLLAFYPPRQRKPFVVQIHLVKSFTVYGATIFFFLDIIL